HAHRHEDRAEPAHGRRRERPRRQGRRHGIEPRQRQRRAETALHRTAWDKSPGDDHRPELAWRRVRPSSAFRIWKGALLTMAMMRADQRYSVGLASLRMARMAGLS